MQPLDPHCLSIAYCRSMNVAFLFEGSATVLSSSYSSAPFMEHAMAKPPHTSVAMIGGVGVVGSPNEIVIKCTNRYLTNGKKSMNQDLLHWVVYMSLLGSVAMCLY